jgi:hypothetical protein
MQGHTVYIWYMFRGTTDTDQSQGGYRAYARDR